jgi:muconate cycloisomerase
LEDPAIDRVETAILDVRWRPHRFAGTGVDAQPILLISSTTRGGATGVGEDVVPGAPGGGEPVETMQLTVERYLAPLLAGRGSPRSPGISRR